MSELKAGDTREFEVGGQKLYVGPIPFGRLKKLIKIVAEVSGQFEKKELADDVLKVVPTILDGYVGQFIPLLFDKERHPFMTEEWVEQNVTIPLMKEILVTAITVNALGDFFAKTVKTPASKTVTSSSGTNQTPSESIGSSTSSDSPTVGVPAT